MNMSNNPIPVAIMGKTFTANQDRMWHLNEIHKGLDLPDSKSHRSGTMKSHEHSKLPEISLRWTR